MSGHPSQNVLGHELLQLTSQPSRVGPALGRNVAETQSGDDSVVDRARQVGVLAVGKGGQAALERVGLLSGVLRVDGHTVAKRLLLDNPATQAAAKGGQDIGRGVCTTLPSPFRQ